MDAYAIRKMVPRILIGVIAINISFYMCLAAVDISKVAAKGVGTLITRPFIAGENFDYKIGGSAATNALAAVGVGTGVYVAGPYLLSMTKTLFAKTGADQKRAKKSGLAVHGPQTEAESAAGPAANTSAGNSKEYLHFIIMFVVVPIALLALSILVTLAILQGIIVFLVIVSPVAFALYILPNTETYFQRWWDLFKRSLLVYPIIAVIFAMSKILSSIIFNANTGFILGVITGTIVMFLPLFMIPFAFKLAGGVAGQIYGAAAGAKDKLANTGYLKGRKEYAKQKAGDRWTRSQAQRWRNANSVLDNTKSTAAQQRSARRMRSFAAGYRSDILLKEAQLNKREAEEQEATSATGDDTLRYAGTADMDLARKQRAAAALLPDGDPRKKGGGANDAWREDENGNLQVKAANGSWHSWSAGEQAEKNDGRGNVAAYQGNLSYVMKKSNTNEEFANIEGSFEQKAESMGMTAEQATGVWKGATYNNQDKWLTGKNQSVKSTVGADGKRKFSVQSDAGKMLTLASNNRQAYAAFVGSDLDLAEATQAGIDASNAIDELDAITASGGTLSVSQQADREKHVELLATGAKIAAAMKGPGMGGTQIDPTTGEPVGIGAPTKPVLTGNPTKDAEAERAYQRQVDEYASVSAYGVHATAQQSGKQFAATFDKLVERHKVTYEFREPSLRGRTATTPPHTTPEVMLDDAAENRRSQRP